MAIIIHTYALFYFTLASFLFIHTLSRETLIHQLCYLIFLNVNHAILITLWERVVLIKKEKSFFYFTVQAALGFYRHLYLISNFFAFTATLRTSKPIIGNVPHVQCTT